MLIRKATAVAVFLLSHTIHAKEEDGWYDAAKNWAGQYIPEVKMTWDDVPSWDLDEMTQAATKMIKDAYWNPFAEPDNKMPESTYVHFLDSREQYDAFREDCKEKGIHALIEFFANWCPHCRAYAPKYAKTSLKLRELGLDSKKLVLAAVDCVDHPDICRAESIHAYPTIKRLHCTNEFNGIQENRDERAIIKYAQGLVPCKCPPGEKEGEGEADGANKTADAVPKEEQEYDEDQQAELAEDETEGGRLDDDNLQTPAMNSFEAAAETLQFAYEKVTEYFSMAWSGHLES